MRSRIPTSPAAGEVSGKKPLPPGEVGGNLPVRAHDVNSDGVFISTRFTLTRSTARDLSRRERCKCPFIHRL
jgi:hypothetical protein